MKNVAKFLLIISPFLIVILLWVVTPFVVLTYFKTDPGTGIFGDMFGSINALFSGLAFAGIIVTILLQRTELSLQRKELESTREVFRKQAFENTFFQLLKTFNEIINYMDIEDIDLQGFPHSQEKPALQGRDCFRHISLEVFSTLLDEVELTSSDTIIKETINQVYLNIYGYYESDLGPYFRILYNIIKFVDTNNEDETSKKNYTNIIRAQLSSPELLLIYYNCISDKGEKLTPLVKKYKLLKHMPQNKITEKIKL